MPSRKEKNLCAFLGQSFSLAELSRWISFSYPELAQTLPGTNASVAEVAFAFVDTATKRGLIDEVFFDRIAEERPRLVKELARVRASWDLPNQASETSGDEDQEIPGRLRPAVPAPDSPHVRNTRAAGSGPLLAAGNEVWPLLFDMMAKAWTFHHLSLSGSVGRAALDKGFIDHLEKFLRGGGRYFWVMRPTYRSRLDRARRLLSLAQELGLPPNEFSIKQISNTPMTAVNLLILHSHDGSPLGATILDSRSSGTLKLYGDGEMVNVCKLWFDSWEAAALPASGLEDLRDPPADEVQDD